MLHQVSVHTLTKSSANSKWMYERSYDKCHVCFGLNDLSLSDFCAAVDNTWLQPNNWFIFISIHSTINNRFYFHHFKRSLSFNWNNWLKNKLDYWISLINTDFESCHFTSNNWVHHLPNHVYYLRIFMTSFISSILFFFFKCTEEVNCPKLRFHGFILDLKQMCIENWAIRIIILEAVI